MIAISSARPPGDVEYDRNQKSAQDSWLRNFDHIYYFGLHDSTLADPFRVSFIDSEPFPRLREMVAFASVSTAGYAAILNADIIVTESIREVERLMGQMALPAATSYRHEFDPDNADLCKAVRHKQDRGMDIFVATAPIWKLVHQNMPPKLRVGHQRWDSWLCGFFCEHLGFGFRQFTDYRCIFHPKHNGRQMPFAPEIAAMTDSYFTRAHVPSPL